MRSNTTGEKENEKLLAKVSVVPALQIPPPMMVVANNSEDKQNNNAQT